MRKGFTLIELLVVIAIIAILAAILFPVFAKARSNAKTTKCLAHGKELGLACAMYMDDNGGRFPRSLTDAEVSALPPLTPYDWPGDVDTTPRVFSSGLAQYRLYQLRRYVKNDAIWICPDPSTLYGQRYAFGYQCSWLPRTSDNFVDGDRGFIQWSEKYPELNNKPLTVYEVIANDASKLDTDGNARKCEPRRLSPSQKIMWMCYSIGIWGKANIGTSGWKSGIFPSLAHGDGSVFVYSDGHAQRKRMGKAWAPVDYTSSDVDNDPGR